MNRSRTLNALAVLSAGMCAAMLVLQAQANRDKDWGLFIVRNNWKGKTRLKHRVIGICSKGPSFGYEGFFLSVNGPEDRLSDEIQTGSSGGATYQQGWHIQLRTGALLPTSRGLGLGGFLCLREHEDLPARLLFGGNYDYATFLLPKWLLIVATAILPILRYRALCRYRRPGLCPKCGYDLRATPHRCPECGSVPAGE